MLCLLVTKPLSACVRSASIATLAWWHLVKDIVNFHVELCCKVLVWIVAAVSLPTRILTALQRERTLHDLKEENLRLHEIQGEAPWVYKACDDNFGSVHEGVGKNYSVPSRNTDYKGTRVDLHDVPMHGDSWGSGEKSKYQEHNPSKPRKLFGDSVVDEMLERRRVVALSRSLFSSIMSLVVGMTIWEAEDPCMPLVAALFSVVGMSLNGVLRFFSTIKNKPAFDAVAWLSVNWFILGALTYPSLPGVALALAPRVIALGDRFVMRLGFLPP